jgi:hypothetical protein
MVTVIDGPPKSSGKSTMILAAARAIALNKLFLNHATKKINVLIVSEENRNTLIVALKLAGVLDLVNLKVIPRSSWRGIPWPVLAQRIRETCIELKIGWLILDTFYAIVGLSETQEYEPGTVVAALNPVTDFTGELNIATTLTRHDRKSGGEVGQSGRGTIALTGAADVVCQLTRVSELYSRTTRQLGVIGRGIEEHLKVELVDRDYVILDAPNTPEAQDQEAKLDKEIAKDPTASIRDLEKSTGIRKNRIAAMARKIGWVQHRPAGTVRAKWTRTGGRPSQNDQDKEKNETHPMYPD